MVVEHLVSLAKHRHPPSILSQSIWLAVDLANTAKMASGDFDSLDFIAFQADASRNKVDPSTDSLVLFRKSFPNEARAGAL